MERQVHRIGDIMAGDLPKVTAMAVQACPSLLVYLHLLGSASRAHFLHGLHSALFVWHWIRGAFPCPPTLLRDVQLFEAYLVKDLTVLFLWPHLGNLKVIHDIIMMRKLPIQQIVLASW